MREEITDTSLENLLLFVEQAINILRKLFLPQHPLAREKQEEGEEGHQVQGLPAPWLQLLREHRHPKEVKLKAEVCIYIIVKEPLLCLLSKGDMCILQFEYS